MASSLEISLIKNADNNIASISKGRNDKVITFLINIEKKTSIGAANIAICSEDPMAVFSTRLALFFLANWITLKCSASFPTIPINIAPINNSPQFSACAMTSILDANNSETMARIIMAPTINIKAILYTNHQFPR